MKKFLLSLLIPIKCFAADLGTDGATFKITENDLLTVIEKRLLEAENSGALERFTDNLKQKMINEPAPVPNIYKASKDTTREFDPSVYLEEDIIAKGKVLYAKGTKINPLDHMDFKKMIFIDGEDKRQREFANIEADKDEDLVVILTSGKPGLQTVDEKNYYYFFDQFGLYSKRFDIQKVPSVVYQKTGEKVLTIDEIFLKDEKN